MSKKTIVEQALDNNVKAEIEKSLPSIPVCVPVYGRKRLNSSNFVAYVQSPVVYPESLTDQTHALTLAEQVRRGQGDAEKPDPKSFDFPDGKDDGSEAHGVFEFAERVDAWLAEQNLSAELKESFKEQILTKQQRDFINNAKKEIDNSVNQVTTPDKVEKPSESAK